MPRKKKQSKKTNLNRTIVIILLVVISLLALAPHIRQDLVPRFFSSQSQSPTLSPTPTPYPRTQEVVSILEDITSVTFDAVPTIRPTVASQYEFSISGKRNAKPFHPTIVDEVYAGGIVVYSLDPNGRDYCGGYGGANCINIIADANTREVLYSDLSRDKSVGAFDRVNGQSVSFAARGSQVDGCGGGGGERVYTYELTTKKLYMRNLSYSLQCPLEDCSCEREDQYQRFGDYEYFDSTGNLISETPELIELFQ